MEEREKDNLANVDDTESFGYSVADVENKPVSAGDDIIQIDDDDIDYDQEYMTNVSNNLVDEVDKVLNNDLEDDSFEDKPLPVIEDEKEEDIVEKSPLVEDEPVKEKKSRTKEKVEDVNEEKVEEKPEKSKTITEVEENEIFDMPSLTEEKSKEDLRREVENTRSFDELKKEAENERLEHKNERVESNMNISGGGKYFSYENRIVAFAVFFAVFFVAGVMLMFQAVNINGEEYINYAETSNLDYKVYLKENDFYQEKYLDKGMLYVASLIDHIDIDYLYNFNISQKVDLDFKYSIIGKLNITDSAGKNVYLTKEYTLLEEKGFELKQEQDHTITEKLSINYDEYNKLANSFKSTYGLDTASSLDVYLKIVKTSKDNTIKDMNNDSNMEIKIPLSQRSVSISMDYKDINRRSNLVKKSSVSLDSVPFLIIAIVLILISLFGLFKLLKLLGLLGVKKSRYDKYINKMMRQYDRLIVKHYTCPDLSNYNVIKLKEFNELLDTRDNLKAPIMFYNVTDHQKSYFYIVNNNDLYLLVLKSVDFEK